jgi:PKD repeat protein
MHYQQIVMQRTAIVILATLMVIIGMVSGVAAADLDTSAPTEFSQASIGYTTTTTTTTTELCTLDDIQNPTVSGGPDFETTKDERVNFVADVEPTDVQITSYEWRAVNGNGKAKAKTRGQSEGILSTARTFETTLKAGQQTITLRAETAEGEILTDTVNVTVRGKGKGATVDSPPIADAGDCRMVIAGEDSTLNGTESYDRDGSIEHYGWDVDGDRTTDLTGETPVTRFTELGTQTVDLTVTDDGDNTDTDSSELFVNDRPRAGFEYMPTRPNPDQTVSFNASVSDDSLGGIERYEWIVDGDPVKTGETIDYAFDETGNHTVELRVTDAYGVTNSTKTTVSVNTPPTADASNSETQGTVGEPVSLSGTASTDPENGITSYEWDVGGDGEFEKRGSTVSDVFDTGGTKSVTLRVTDDGGLADTDTVTVNVNAPPEAAITSTAATAIVDDSVGFDGTESADPDGEITSYEWTFSDGTTATGSTVDHAPSVAGSYTVSLTVTDDDGATDTASRSITVLPDEIDSGDGDNSDDGSDGDGTVGLPSAPENADGGTGWGDPHMITFDGRTYDFQAAGEYVLARAPSGSLSVQARLDPINDRISVIDAVATEIDGHNVSIDAADSTPLVVDGQRQVLGSTDSLAVGDGRVFRRGSTYIVVYPGDDGAVDAGDERLIARTSSSRIDVSLTLDTGREQAVEGILGTPDGSAPDIALANGTPVSPSDFETLYGPFRDDWRVETLEQSHFHYENGESPDSFYDPDQPTQLFSVDDLSEEQRSAAEQAALDAGLELGTAAFEDAVLDYALTEDESYLESAALSRPANASFTVDAGSSFEANVSESATLTATVQNASAEDVSVAWRFGDGETATGTEVSHSYDEVGTYTVTATATGPNGGIARDTLTVTATGLPPVANVTETQLNESHIQLDASGSTDPDGSIAGYAWDTDGDGSVDARGETVIVSPGAEVTEVSVVVVDDDGNQASTTVAIDLTKTIIDEDFSGGTAGFTSDTGNLETRSGDGVDILAPVCSRNAQTNSVSKRLDADVDSFTYDISVIALDTWDRHDFSFEYRDDSGWHTLHSDNFYGSGLRLPAVNCRNDYDSSPPATYSGTIRDVDGTLHEIRFTNTLDQSDWDESMAIDYVRINRTG